MEEYRDYDKNTFHLPRQYLPQHHGAIRFPEPDQQIRPHRSVLHDSAATSREEIGNPVHHGTRRKLKEVGIPCGDHRARQLEKREYDEFDYLIGMDSMNIRNMMRILGGDPKGKVSKLLDFTERTGQDIADPWYTGNFDRTYEDVKEGCEALLQDCLLRL